MFPGFASVNEEESISTIIKAAIQEVHFTPIFISVTSIPFIFGILLFIFQKNIYISSIIFVIMSLFLLFTQNINNFLIIHFPNETFDQKAFIIFLFWGFPIISFLFIFTLIKFFKMVIAFFSEIKINIPFFKKSKSTEENNKNG